MGADEVGGTSILAWHVEDLFHAPDFVDVDEATVDDLISHIGGHLPH